MLNIKCYQVNKFIPLTFLKLTVDHHEVPSLLVSSIIKETTVVILTDPQSFDIKNLSNTTSSWLCTKHHLYFIFAD